MDVPLVPQLARLLADRRRRSGFAKGSDWVFATADGTPYGHRNVTRRGLPRAARCVGIDGGTRAGIRFHDLRHCFASHLILDLGTRCRTDQPHPRPRQPTITLNVYTHLFEKARHVREIRARMAASPFARPLDPVKPAPIEPPVRRPRQPGGGVASAASRRRRG
jgi:integrase